MQTISYEAHKESTGSQSGTRFQNSRTQDIQSYLQAENLRVLKQIYGEDIVERLNRSNALNGRK